VPLQVGATETEDASGKVKEASTSKKVKA